MQHYGLANVWENGDIITRCILSALLIMSVLSWTVILIKLDGRVMDREEALGK